MEKEAQGINKEKLRLWLRKMYKCTWSYGKDVITITCDGEEFHINPDKLDMEERFILLNIIKNETGKVDKSV